MEWELEYEMLNEFEMLKDLSAESFEALYRAMLSNATKLNEYDSFNNYFSLNVSLHYKFQSYQTRMMITLFERYFPQLSYGI